MPAFQLLQNLPDELRQAVLERLDRQDLFNLNRTSRWGYELATPLIWKEVELVDCRNGADEHDDSPLIRKLIILASNEWLASHVQTLTHKCHLPTPSIFQELPYMQFSSQTLSTDPRTTKLVQLAASLMRNVRTLRIILGHPALTDALLRCFFAKGRQAAVGVRRLWLENCRISAGLNASLDWHPYGLPLELDFSGLESVRFRRLPFRPGVPFERRARHGKFEVCHSRGMGRMMMWQDGAGGRRPTTTIPLAMEQRWVKDWIPATSENDHHHLSVDECIALPESPLGSLYQHVFRVDDQIYNTISATMTVPEEVMALDNVSYKQRAFMAYRGIWLDPEDMSNAPADPLVYLQNSRKDNLLTKGRDWRRLEREKIPSAAAGVSMLGSAGASLTSITLDWVQTVPKVLGYSRDQQAFDSWIGIFSSLFKCRFPHLRAFQLRNCVALESRLPHGIYLFDRCRPHFGDIFSTLTAPAGVSADLAPLAFMEAHPKLQCLSWPMDHFFSPEESSPDIVDRVLAVINNLGRTLEDLRVDTLYADLDERQTDEYDCRNLVLRACRRRFISYFASKMTKVKSIKVEGGVPRDERRETVRALHACPLEKIVLIGVNCPLGNTWGPEGIDAHHIFPEGERSQLTGMQAEDKDAVFEFAAQKLRPIEKDSTFSPQYEWHGVPPMMHCLASNHAATVKELKFCGYRGAPILFHPTPITTPFLSSLKHFHNLESLILSFWLPTGHEAASRDAEIIQYWLDARSPASTALVAPSGGEDEPSSWATALRTKYSPQALAAHVTDFVAPFLSERAKGRVEGVTVRASFNLGEEGGIFDLDLRVGRVAGADVCLRFVGPREEGERERWKGKLEGRRWF